MSLQILRSSVPIWVAAGLFSILPFSDALAISQERPPGRFDQLVRERAEGSIGVRAESVSALPADDQLRLNWEPLASAQGGGWRAWIDGRSGYPTLATGRGIAWFAGAGNDLPTGQRTDLDDLAARAEKFLRDHPAVLGDWGDQVVLDREASVRRGADVWQLRFGQVVDGVPVEGAYYDFHVAHGNLVALGARHFAPVRVSALPELTAAQAWRKLDAYVRPRADDGIVDVEQPELLIVPANADPSAGRGWKGTRGEGYAHRLIWRFVFTDLDGIATWTGEVDAHTSEIVAFYDDTDYGQIKGHVNPNSDDGHCEIGGCPESDYPMPFVDYRVDGGAAQYANQFGLYECATPGSTIETNLDGQYFRINDQCGLVDETATCDDDLDLGVADDINCGAAPGASPGNTDAARSAYYSLNLVNRKARFWTPGIPWLDSQVECRTNVDATCNATYGSGRINMYRAGNGCGNTGQIQGVLVHEWGHGFDHNDGGGEDDPGEAYADVVAIFEARDSCMGPGFHVAENCSGYGDDCLTCTGIRDMDWDARRRHTPATPSDFIAGLCPGGVSSGACGHEVHCESYVPSEAIYDLATRDLPAMGVDLDTAWQLAERLWYQSRAGSGGDIYNCSLPDSDSCSTGSWYHQLRVQDDDDGNLSNGTPHAAAIFAAFDRHDIACGAATDAENQNSSSCPALDAPLVGFTAQTNAVNVFWDPVGGGAAYRVYRNENGCERSQFPVAEVDGTTTQLLDDGLANSFPVYYRVQAIGSNAACESPVSACMEAAAQPTGGRIFFDRASYGCAHEIRLRVSDANHPASSMTVTIWSDSEPSPESVLLTETSVGSSLFTGSIFTTSAPAAADGMLSTIHGDAITAEYIDLDDGQGGVNLQRHGFAVSDCIGPVIFDVRDSEVGLDRAALLWFSDKASTSTVYYGETVPPDLERSVTAPVTDHDIRLNLLGECTIYHYAVESVDPAGNVAYDDNGGAYHHFETYVDLGAGPQPCHQGRVGIDVDPVGCATGVPVRLGDIDLNTDPGLVETAVVALESTTEPAPESLVLTETGPDTGIFTGTIPTENGLPVPGDGILQITTGDTVTATYQDVDDGTGAPRVHSDSSAVDCLGPEILTVSVTSITDSSAYVQWTTSETTTGYADWGSTPTGGNQASSSSGSSTQHSARLEPLPECGRVYFRVVATDGEGHTSVADAAGAPFEFNAATIGGTIFRDDFESAGGWSLEGEWEIGAPQTLGTAPGDPSAAFSGAGVLGHDLTGLGSWPGDYEPSQIESAVSPSIDASAATTVELNFYRWVNAASGSVAYLEVADGGGSWHEVWSSPAFGGITESSWGFRAYDVTQWAAGNADFRIRFRQHSYTPVAHAAGWNADQLILRDSTQPQYESCGGCGGAPTFAGVLSATDDDPCADSSVTLNWSEAPAWGTGSGGSYVVYRDAQDRFTPSPANRVASGIQGTTWTDNAAPAGIPLYYIVRAENDETCAYGPNNGGMMDGNLRVAIGMNGTGQSPPGDVGPTLRVDAANSTDTRLTWSPAPAAATYRVYRSALPDGGFAQIGEPVDPQYDDAGAFADAEDWYYLILAADACGNASGN